MREAHFPAPDRGREREIDDLKRIQMREAQRIQMREAHFLAPDEACQAAVFFFFLLLRT